MKKKINTFFFVIAFLGIAFDQITKIFFFNYFKVQHFHNDYFQNQPNIQIIGNFLQFTYVENAGMAFGIGFGEFKFILSIFSIVASIVLSIYLYKLRYFDKYVQLGIALILAGATGNLIDRVFYGIIFNYGDIFWGRVIDFILVDIPDINILGLYYTHFPVFNIADSLVTIGVAFLIIFHNRIPTLKEILSPKNDNNEEFKESSDKVAISGEE